MNKLFFVVIGVFVILFVVSIISFILTKQCGKIERRIVVGHKLSNSDVSIQQASAYFKLTNGIDSLRPYGDK